ncbi:hypothetical protein L6R29_04760 [Myxococcota bacterium]|nr:hypothetical protein [Myxococcota bacterium]
MPLYRSLCNAPIPLGRFFCWFGVSALIVMAGVQATHAQSTRPTAQKERDSMLLRHRIEMGAQVDFSRDARAPFGAGLRVGYQYRMLAQIHLGAWVHWAYHGVAQEARAALGLHLLLDLLPIMPFLQLSFGLQTRLTPIGLFFTPDVHAALGVEIPISTRWRLGAAFHFYLPTSPESFPTTQSLLLHAAWVW